MMHEFILEIIIRIFAITLSNFSYVYAGNYLAKYKYNSIACVKSFNNLHVFESILYRKKWHSFRMFVAHQKRFITIMHGKKFFYLEIVIEM